MGRIPDSDLENSRLLAPPDSPFPKGLDDDIWNTDAILPKGIDDPYVPYPPLRSHVLLAACQHDELAYEIRLSTTGQHAGAFTTLLLDLLRQPRRTLTETTYVGLFHILEQRENKSRLPRQTPYVEGENKTRILFSMTDLGRQFPVLLHDDGSFSVAAGTIHGIDGETVFAITSCKNRFEGLRPFKVFPLSCSFSKSHDLTLRDDSRAEVTKWNRLHPKVFVQEKSDGPPDSHEYDLVIFRSPNGTLQLKRQDGLIPRYVENDILFDPQDAAADLSTANAQISGIIDAITLFNFHLHRQSDFSVIGNKLRVKLERLSPQPGEHRRNVETFYFPVKGGEDFLASGEVIIPGANVKKGPKVTAAVKIPDLKNYFSFTLSVSDVQTPLFPYVFAFDPSTYQIAVCGFAFVVW